MSPFPPASSATTMFKNVGSCLERTRTILVGMPRMLCGIITELVSAEPDLTIVGEFDDCDQTLQAIERNGADVVIAGLNGVAPAQVSHLLSERPRLRILAVSRDGGETFLYELRPHERLLGEISPQTLLAAIRGRVSDVPSHFTGTEGPLADEEGA